MDYITRHYKNLSEDLQKRLNYLQYIIEAPSGKIPDDEFYGAHYINDLDDELDLGSPTKAIQNSADEFYGAHMIEPDADELDLSSDFKKTQKSSPKPSPKPSQGAILKNIAKGGVAGLIGGVAGEYAVKPAAEKAGVFDAVETGTRKGLSSMPPWAANVADAALGAAQVALDPVSAAAEAIEKRANQNLQSIRKTAPASGQDYAKASREARERRAARGIIPPEQSQSPEDEAMSNIIDSLKKRGLY